MGGGKNTPALLMGAASVDLPTIGVSGGPMLRGIYRGTKIGSGTAMFEMSEELRAGNITLDEFHGAEACMHRSQGHCMVMGTRSEEHTSELQSLMRISYAVFCLKKKKNLKKHTESTPDDCINQ